jgi:hypothetical protein
MFLGSDVFRQWAVVAARMLSGERERSAWRNTSLAKVAQLPQIFS